MLNFPHEDVTGVCRKYILLHGQEGLGKIPSLTNRIIKQKYSNPFMSYNLLNYFNARIAQSVEQRIENPCVGGSIPSPGTLTT